MLRRGNLSIPIVVIVFVMSSSCVTHWNHPTKTSEDFQRDDALCEASSYGYANMAVPPQAPSYRIRVNPETGYGRAVPSPDFSPLSRVALASLAWGDCMKKLGWYQVKKPRTKKTKVKLSEDEKLQMKIEKEVAAAMKKYPIFNDEDNNAHYRRLILVHIVADPDRSARDVAADIAKVWKTQWIDKNEPSQICWHDEASDNVCFPAYFGRYKIDPKSFKCFQIEGPTTESVFFEVEQRRNVLYVWDHDGVVKTFTVSMKGGKAHGHIEPGKNGMSVRLVVDKNTMRMDVLSPQKRTHCTLLIGTKQ